MVQIKQLKDDNGNQFYPRTTERAVLDENGNSLESKMASIQQSIGNLATVATTGSYNDLTDKPSITQSDWNQTNTTASDYIKNKPGNASTSVKGLVQLSSDTTSQSTSYAATPLAVYNAIKKAKKSTNHLLQSDNTFYIDITEDSNRDIWSLVPYNRQYFTVPVVITFSQPQYWPDPCEFTILVYNGKNNVTFTSYTSNYSIKYINPINFAKSNVNYIRVHRTGEWIIVQSSPVDSSIKEVFPVPEFSPTTAGTSKHFIISGDVTDGTNTLHNPIVWINGSYQLSLCRGVNSWLPYVYDASTNTVVEAIGVTSFSTYALADYVSAINSKYNAGISSNTSWNTGGSISVSSISAYFDIS